MTSEITEKMVKIISQNILTPIIYMLENDGIISFICFCDRNITMQEIYNVEQIIKNETGQTAEIIDIREFDESNRLEIVNTATLIHSEHPLIENIFTQLMIEDYKIAMEERQGVLIRQKELGTCYLQ